MVSRNIARLWQDFFPNGVARLRQDFFPNGVARRCATTTGFFSQIVSRDIAQLPMTGFFVQMVSRDGAHPVVMEYLHYLSLRVASDMRQRVGFASAFVARPRATSRDTISLFGVNRY
jgi:hypothetical protein